MLVVIRQLVLLQVLPVITGTVLVVIRQLVLLLVLTVITGTVLVVIRQLVLLLVLPVMGTGTAGTLAGTPCYNWDSAGTVCWYSLL